MMVQDRCPVKTYILLSHQWAAKSHEKLLSIDLTKYLFLDKIGYICEINFNLEQPLGKFVLQISLKREYYVIFPLSPAPRVMILSVNSPLYIFLKTNLSDVNKARWWWGPTSGQVNRYTNADTLLYGSRGRSRGSSISMGEYWLIVFEKYFKE